MLLDVSRALKNPGQSYPVDGIVSLPPMSILRDEVRFDDVHFTGTFVGSGDSVSLAGTVTCVANAHCANCLMPVQTALTAALAAVYAQHPDPENPDVRLLVGDTVDLTDAVSEAVLLEMPIRVLCQSDCQGLCQDCGINLNVERCSCRDGGAPSGAFSVLTGLLRDKDDDGKHPTAP